MCCVPTHWQTESIYIIDQIDNDVQTISKVFQFPRYLSKIFIIPCLKMQARIKEGHRSYRDRKALYEFGTVFI